MYGTPKMYKVAMASYTRPQERLTLAMRDFARRAIQSVVVRAARRRERLYSERDAGRVK
jgi:hypothetical protein